MYNCIGFVFRLTLAPSGFLATSFPSIVTASIAFVEIPGIHPKRWEPVAPSMHSPGAIGSSPGLSVLRRQDDALPIHTQPSFNRRIEEHDTEILGVSKVRRRI